MSFLLVLPLLLLSLFLSQLWPLVLEPGQRMKQLPLPVVLLSLLLLNLLVVRLAAISASATFAFTGAYAFAMGGVPLLRYKLGHLHQQPTLSLIQKLALVHLVLEQENCD